MPAVAGALNHCPHPLVWPSGVLAIRPVVGIAVLLTALSGWYAATHFSMTTDINQLISTSIPWRQRELAFEKAFPQYELIVAVIDAPTPELVDEATGALVQRLCWDGFSVSSRGLLSTPVRMIGSAARTGLGLGTFQVVYSLTA